MNLPFGEINVVVLTDVHSWIGGHSNEPKHNANYGDVLSFYQRLREHCRSHQMDLWFVVNGDWIDGTGLSLDGDISYLTPLLEKMEWDALNVGNHELYRDDVVNSFSRPGGFVESWGDRYLSSNVLHTNTQRPLGKRYRFLRGRNATVLTFGFLYNMEDASKTVTVEKVEDVVEQPWFEDVVTNAKSDPDGKFDAIMVLAHMDVQDELVTVLLNKIRPLVGDTMPVQFITGHTHIRAVHTMDAASVSFEAGKYLDTLGFVSFPTQKTIQKMAGNRNLQGDEEEGEAPALLGPGGTEWPNVSDSNTTIASSTTAPSLAPLAAATGSPSTTSAPASHANVTAKPTKPPATTSPTNATAKPTKPPATPNPTPAPTPKPAADLFHNVFIDADVATFESILGIQGLPTEDGGRLSKFIFRTRSELGLLDLVGCSPQPYYLNRTLEEQDSLWKVFLDEVAPYKLLQPISPNQQRMFLGPSAGFRYDLLGTQLIRDDVIAVAPFNDSIFTISPPMSGAVIARLVKEVLNKEPNPYDDTHDFFMLSPGVDDLSPDTQYEIMAPEWGTSDIIAGLKQIDFNGTVEKKEAYLYATDIWLEFVKDNWKCKANDNTHSEEQDSSGHGSSHHPSGGSSSSSSTGHGHNKGVHSGAPRYQGSNPAKDKRRTIMAGIALGLVAVLGTIYIWQLHRDWLVKYNQRQRLIFIADQENNDEFDDELI